MYQYVLQINSSFLRGIKANEYMIDGKNGYLFLGNAKENKVPILFYDKSKCRETAMALDQVS